MYMSVSDGEKNVTDEEGMEKEVDAASLIEETRMDAAGEEEEEEEEDEIIAILSRSSNGLRKALQAEGM